MQRSLERFERSPAAFFEHVDRSFADQRAWLAALAQRTDALAAMCEELARTRVAAAAFAVPQSRWTYDARLPNYVFDDVFEPELATGGTRRWVGTSGRIGTTLRLPRHVQYDFVVQVDAFASEAAARSFFLRIDGVAYPWLSRDDNRFVSLVLADEEVDDMSFECGVSPASVPPGRDGSFAFRLIDVARRT